MFRPCARRSSHTLAHAWVAATPAGAPIGRCRSARTAGGGGETFAIYSPPRLNWRRIFDFGSAGGKRSRPELAARSLEDVVRAVSQRRRRLPEAYGLLTKGLGAGRLGRCPTMDGRWRHGICRRRGRHHGFETVMAVWADCTLGADGSGQAGDPTLYRRRLFLDGSDLGRGSTRFAIHQAECRYARLRCATPRIVCCARVLGTHPQTPSLGGGEAGGEKRRRAWGATPYRSGRAGRSLTGAKVSASTCGCG